MVKLLIADDHLPFRQSLKDLVEDNVDLVVVAEASNGYEVLDAMEKAEVDVILLDLNMPGKGGLETLIELKREYPSLPVLIISFHCAEQYASYLIRMGAAGFISKHETPERLIHAIQSLIPEPYL
jgi:two-component system, NarL family, invasion response regulator UvrY